MFANVVWPPKLANIYSFYVFLIQDINGSCILSHSFAKMASMGQGKKGGKHTPPQRWGANIYIHIYGYIYIYINIRARIGTKS